MAMASQEDGKSKGLEPQRTKVEVLSCPKCGAALPMGVVACGYCGVGIDWGESGSLVASVDYQEAQSAQIEKRARQGELKFVFSKGTDKVGRSSKVPVVRAETAIIESYAVVSKAIAREMKLEFGVCLGSAVIEKLFPTSWDISLNELSIAAISLVKGNIGDKFESKLTLLQPDGCLEIGERADIGCLVVSEGSHLELGDSSRVENLFVANGVKLVLKWA